MQILSGSLTVKALKGSRLKDIGQAVKDETSMGSKTAPNPVLTTMGTSGMMCGPRGRKALPRRSLSVNRTIPSLPTNVRATRCRACPGAISGKVRALVIDTEKCIKCGLASATVRGSIGGGKWR